MPIEQREARGPRSRRTRSVAAKFVFQAAMLLQHCSMYACCASQRGHNLYSTETLRGAPTHPDTRIRVRRIIAGSVATLSLVAAIATVTVGAHPRTGKHYSAMPFHSAAPWYSSLQNLWIKDTDWQGMQAMVQQSSAAPSSVSLFQLPRITPSHMQMHHVVDYLQHTKAYVTSFVPGSRKVLTYFSRRQGCVTCCC